LLLNHDPQKPVGHVTFSAPTAAGLLFTATLPMVDDAGAVRNRVDEAWHSVKAGLLQGVSIGFMALAKEWNKATGGYRFLKTEILELSLVAIPANRSATILTVKSLDLAAPAPIDPPEDLPRLAREICDSEPLFFSMETLHEAGRVAHKDPAQLSNRHLAHIACYQPKTILPLLEKRAAAQQADRHAADQRRAAVVARARATPPMDAAALAAMSPEDFCQRFPHVPVTLEMLAPVLKFTDDMNARNKERNAKIAALEARVLELEASAAAVRS
jgi:HK97 family phage prohead protease